MPANAVVDVTGVTPQQLAPTLAQGRAYRVIGFGLTSSGTGVAILKCGSTEVARVVLPGGEVAQPNIDWGFVGADSGPLTVAADTAGVRICGHVCYDTIPITIPVAPQLAFHELPTPVRKRPDSRLVARPVMMPIPISSSGLE